MTSFLLSLLILSCKATLVVGVVLVTQALFRRFLPAGFRLALWGLVALRLLSPELPQSPLSVLRTAAPVPPISEIPGLGPWLGAAPGVGSPAMDLPLASVVPGGLFDGSAWLLGLWILVASILLVRWAHAHRKIRGIVQRAQVLRDSTAQRSFEACRDLLGIDQSIALYESSEVDGPASCGVLRPAVIVPSGFLAHLTEDQRRNVFLHELAHISRRDSAWLQLAHLLLVIHWFNPFLWFALRRFESDLELACDATVLSQLKPSDRPGYGKTLLEVGVRPLFAAPSPCFAVGSENELKRRILMITQFRSLSWRRGVLLASLALLLVLVSLTEIPESLARGTGGAVPATAEELAERMVDILESDRNPGAMASEMARLLESHRSPWQEVESALRQAAAEHGEDDIARSLIALADLERTRRTGDGPQGGDASAWTISQIRNVGTSMYHKIWNPSFAARRTDGKIEPQTNLRWLDCPAISRAELQELIGPNFEVPEQDAWGGTLEFCLDQDFDQAHGLIGVRSPGSDGRFDHDAYEVGGFDPSQTANDIVWMDGYFVRWPGT